MVCTYGIHVPAGLFVPSLLLGATYGRLLHLILDTWFHSQSDIRLYALIGAASVLGGITRMTISLTVILMECTGNVQLGLPLLVTLFAARFVGNCFNEGIYDEHVHISHYPFLPPEPPLCGTFLR